MNKQVSTQTGNSANLVFNFEDIFNAWLQGKCTTKYLQIYINEQVTNRFVEALEQIGGKNDLHTK